MEPISTSLAVLTSAAGSAIVELGRHLRKKAQKIGNKYTVTIDENDQTFRSWYSRNITPQHHAISQNVGAVNGVVKQRSFRIEDFKQLDPDQQFMMAGVLYALKSIDSSVAQQIEELQESHKVSFSRIDSEVKQLRGQLGSQSQKLGDRIDSRSVGPLQAQPEQSTIAKKIAKTTVYGVAGVGVIYLVARASTWVEENPEKAAKVLKSAVVTGGIILGGLLAYTAIKKLRE